MLAHRVSVYYQARVLAHRVSVYYQARVSEHQAWAPRVLALHRAWVPPESVQHRVRVPVAQVLDVVALVLIVKAPKARVQDPIAAAQ
jgi:hypothetical protein